MLGLKAAWELASSGANERVTGWDAGIVEADAAAGGAGDTVFVDLAAGLGPLLHYKYQQNLDDRAFSISPDE